MHARKAYSKEPLKFKYFNISNIEFKKHHKLVLKYHALAYELTGNPLIAERYYEILKAKSGLIAKLGAKKIKQELQHLTTTSPKSPQYRFAFAKNLIFFGNRKEKTLGKRLLSSLANREFSETFIHHMDERKKQEEIERKAREEAFQKHYSDLINYIDEI